MSASKSHRHDGNDFVNRWDFRCRRNDDRVDAAVTVGGRLFQACTTSGQETERVHSYNPGARTGLYCQSAYPLNTAAKINLMFLLRWKQKINKDKHETDKMMAVVTWH